MLHVLLASINISLIASEACADSAPSVKSRDLARIRDIGGYSRGAISVSPNGKYVAFHLQAPNFQARNYDLSWYVIESSRDGKRWKADGGGDLILNPNKSWLINGSRRPVEAQWSSDSKRIFYLKRFNESTQLWRSRRDGIDSERLTHNSADILSFWLSEDTDEIYFTTAIPDEERLRLLREEGDRGFLYDDRFHPSMKRSPFARVCGTDNQGRVNAVSLERACSPPLWIYDVNTNTERKATEDEIEAFRRQTKSLAPPRKDGKAYVIARRGDNSVVWLENDDPENYSGWRPPMRLFAIVNGNEFRCSARKCRGPADVIEGAWWRPGRDEIIFQRADGASKSMTGLYSWKPYLDEVREIILTEGKLSDCEALASRAICLREEWTHPQTISSIGFENGRVETLYDPNPEFNGFRFSKIEKIEWEDEFGNPTHGHLIYPLNYEIGRRYPLVITTYRSRGFLRGSVGDEYPIHVLAASGFMVLSFDTPSTFRRDAVIETSGQAQWEGMYEQRSALSAQEEVLKVLDSRGLIDPDNVAITGLSAGAMQVMFALAHRDMFSAGIVSSAYDWRSGYYSSNEKRRLYRRRVFGGAPYNDKAGIFKALSLALNAQRVSAPLLINVSDWELQSSVESFVRLQDAGKPVEMYVFPDEYHIKWQPQHRLAIYRRNIQWLKFWLQGEEVDDPVDPEQYSRWRGMRDEQCVQLKDQEDAPWYCRR